MGLADDDNPFAAPAATEAGPDEGGRRIPLRLIPAGVCLIYGASMSALGLALLGLFAFARVRFGPISPRPETPAMNRLAWSLRNLLQPLLALLAGVFSLAAGRWYWKRSWSSALLATLAIVLIVYARGDLKRNGVIP